MTVTVREQHYEDDLPWYDLAGLAAAVAEGGVFWSFGIGGWHTSLDRGGSRPHGSLCFGPYATAERALTMGIVRMQR